jgi:hypothetical protein
MVRSTNLIPLEKSLPRNGDTFFHTIANTMNVVWVCSIILVSYSEFAINQHKDPSVIKTNDKLKIIMNSFKMLVYSMFG